MVERAPDRRRTESVANTGDSDRPPSVSRHDLVLAAIPAALVVAALLGQILSIPSQSALVGGAVVAALAVGDGLFRNPPGRRRTA
ncbi:hypothetical protein [Natronoarchaeum philippinense]|nr:hypothetical protein [Natronoarchaeum philippinense]